MSSLSAFSPRSVLKVSVLFEIPSKPKNSISELSKARRMARKDSVFISEWPFSKLLMAVFDRPHALAKSCCVHPKRPRAPLHCSIVSIVTLLLPFYIREIIYFSV